MAVTWEKLSVKYGDDENFTLIIRELSDRAPTGKQFQERLNKKHPMETFKANLKKQILEDRAKDKLKAEKEDIFSNELDLSGFEEYLKEEV